MLAGILGPLLITAECVQDASDSPLPRLQAAACMAADASGHLLPTEILLHGGSRDAALLGDLWQATVSTSSIVFTKLSSNNFDSFVRRSAHIIMAMNADAIMILPTCSLSEEEVSTHDQTTWGVHIRDTGEVQSVQSHHQACFLLQISKLPEDCLPACISPERRARTLFTCACEVVLMTRSPRTAGLSLSEQQPWLTASKHEHVRSEQTQRSPKIFTRIARVK